HVECRAAGERREQVDLDAVVAGGDPLHDAQVGDGARRDLRIVDRGQRLPHRGVGAGSVLRMVKTLYHRAPGWARYRPVISSHRAPKSSDRRPHRPPAPANPPSWTHRPPRRTSPGAANASPPPSIAPEPVGTTPPTSAPRCA